MGSVLKSYCNQRVDVRRGWRTEFRAPRVTIQD